MPLGDMGARGSGLERASKVGGNRRGFVAQLTPGDAGGAPALGEEDPVALPVALEGAGRCVHGATVQLDHQPLGLPEAIDLEESAAQDDRRVELRPRQAVRRLAARAVPEVRPARR